MRRESFGNFYFLVMLAKTPFISFSLNQELKLFLKLSFKNAQWDLGAQNPQKPTSIFLKKGLFHSNYIIFGKQSHFYFKLKPFVPMVLALIAQDIRFTLARC